MKLSRSRLIPLVGLGVLIAMNLADARGGVLLTVSAGVNPGNGTPTGGGGTVGYSSSTGFFLGSVGVASTDTTVSYTGTMLSGQDPSFVQFAVMQTGYGGRSASAYAEVDLANGLWRQIVSTTDPGGGTADGVSDVRINEQLAFHADGASASNPIPISVGLFIEGNFNLGPGGFGSIDLPAFEFEGQGGADGSVVYDTNTRVGIVLLSASSAWISTDFTGTDAHDLFFHGVYPLIFPDEVVNVSIETIGDFSQEGTAGYGNTLGMSLDLPAGVTFTSTDGFLTAPASAPEPGSLGLALGGFAVLAAWKGRWSRDELRHGA
ncbi:MAG TPA: hypothetical protein VL742_00590 [Casimicrobiaceae bacterium]|nr:hypothetical protein [Casimicrobiaceae bacterium]